MNTKKRCEWCLKDQLYIDYHDNEWGIPSHDDDHLFEHLILETFQAGLSWYTILKKRESFRIAFDNFDMVKMANYSEPKVESLMQDKSIIRSESKIRAAINNAKMALLVINEFGSLDRYMWQFTDFKTVRLKVSNRSDVQTTTTYSDHMSKDMKKRGFKFIGSITCMAYMEAVGIINHHYDYCWKAK